MGEIPLQHLLVSPEDSVDEWTTYAVETGQETRALEMFLIAEDSAAVLVREVADFLLSPPFNYLFEDAVTAELMVALIGYVRIEGPSSASFACVVAERGAATGHGCFLPNRAMVLRQRGLPAGSNQTLILGADTLTYRPPPHTVPRGGAVGGAGGGLANG